MVWARSSGEMLLGFVLRGIMDKTKTCENCPDRHAGCHDKCEEYIARSAKLAERRERIRKAKEKDAWFRAGER